MEVEMQAKNYFAKLFDYFFVFTVEEDIPNMLHSWYVALLHTNYFDQIHQLPNLNFVCRFVLEEKEFFENRELLGCEVEVVDLVVITKEMSEDTGLQFCRDVWVYLK